MSKRMLIDAGRVDETRVVVMDENRIDVVDYENVSHKQLKSNVYLARVTRVEPSLQAAFVDYGGNRHGFLPFSEIHHDYYQIPAEDRDQLIAEAAQRLSERQAARAKARSDAKKARKQSASQSAQTAASPTGDTLAEASGTDTPQVSEAFVSPIQIIEEQEQPLFNELIPTVNDESDLADLSNIEVVEQDNAIVTVTVDEQDDQDDQEAVPFDTADPALEKAVDQVIDAVLDTAATMTKGGANAPYEALVDEAEMDIDDLARLDGALAQEAHANSQNIKADGESADDDDDDEDVGGEDDELEGRVILRQIIGGRYKIQDVIKRRQVMLIQVSKEERGNKGAALTTYLSLAGRYCVLMPNTQRGGGISRKIANPKDRRKLKQILEEISIPSGISVIVRTAGSERSKAEIKRDFEYLMRTWDEIRENTLTSEAPALVYEEGNVIKRAVRDLYSRDMDEIIVDGQDGYDAAKSFMRTLTPSHAKKVRQHKSATPLFLDAGIEAQLDTLHDPVVPLASGGYLVMNQTEALVAVDVNSGKATKERNIEDTALQTNLEAASEVARQLRLRDMAGLVVIDFIDMDENRHRSQVERRLRDAMKGDRARIQLGRISGFGLLELSRQRLRPSVFETSMQACPTCSGTGLVRTDISFGRAILRRAEQIAQDNDQACESVEITVPFNVGILILNQLRTDLVAMEQRLGCEILVVPDAHTDAPNFRVGLHANGRVQNFEEGGNKRENAAGEGRRGRGRRNERRNNERSDRSDRQQNNRRKGSDEPADTADRTQAEASPDNAEASPSDGEGQKRSGRKRGGRNRRKGQDSAPVADENAVSSDNAQTESQVDDVADDERTVDTVDATDDESKKRSRRRGKRGGRRRGKKDENEAAESENAPSAEAEAEAESKNGSNEPVDKTEKAADGANDIEAKPASNSNIEGIEAPQAAADTGSIPASNDGSDQTADASSDAEVAPVQADTPPKEGPKRKGWFSRARDALTGK